MRGKKKAGYASAEVKVERAACEVVVGMAATGPW
jgi:hypothetical protein